MGTHLSAWKELWENKAESCSKITSKGYSSDLSLAVPTSPWALTLPEACLDSVPNPHLIRSSCEARKGKEKDEARKRKEKKKKEKTPTNKQNKTRKKKQQQKKPPKKTNRKMWSWGSWTPSQAIPESLGVHPHSTLLQGGIQPSLFGKVGHKFWVVYRIALTSHSHHCSHHTSLPEWGDRSSSSKLRRHERFKLMVGVLKSLRNEMLL